MKGESYFRQLDQDFERRQPDRLPRYWNHEGHLWCPYCDAAVREAHPTEALDVCPVYERFLADQEVTR